MARKKLKMLTTLCLAVGLIGLASVPAKAAEVTPPAFTSATYDESTGKLTITGTNLVAKEGTPNDIVLSKVTITDSKSKSYTLKSKGELNASSTTTAEITLSAKERAALAAILDKDGTAAANGGTYQIDVQAGWNGTTSKADISDNALTVSNVAGLTSATYDCSTGKIVLTGTNLVATTGTPNDILPKYLTITDGASKSYKLTSPAVEITSATSAEITLNAKDKLALQSVFDKNGTTSTAGNAYNIKAAYGWNGKTTLASLGKNALTVSNFAAPTITFTDVTVVYKKYIAIPANTSTKLGTIYVVPSTTDLDTTNTQAKLEALVTGKTALKATISNVATALSISTTPLTFTVDTATYKLVVVDKAGVLSSLSTGTITLNNVNAPALSATAAKGTISGTKVTATAGTGNSLRYKVSSTTNTAPKFYEAVDTDATTAYTSGTDITTVSTTNKYLAIYEVNASGKVVKYKQFTLTATYIKVIVDKTSAAFTVVDANNVVTITLTGGTFKTGAIAASDFTFTGTNAAALAGGTFTRTSDTVVTITEVDLAAGTTDKVLVKAATQATQATSVAAVASTTVTAITDVTSVAFTVTEGNNTVTITLTGGTFKEGSIVAGDFTFTGTNAAALADGTFVRTSATVVTITATLAAANDDTVLVKAATQATQASSVAGAASTVN
ncbi:MAG: hypothetical protein PHF63_02790 [Herbinix sp.]|nr:hypothetical protein [Herbinix sp.]